MKESRRKFFLVIVLFIIPLSASYAQDIEGAIRRLEEKEMLTRIIEKYRQDPRRPAYLSELILAIDEAVRGKQPSPDLLSKINKMESDILQLKKRISGFSSDKDRDEEIEYSVRKIVREYLTEFLGEVSSTKISGITTKLKSDSLEIAKLKDRIKILEQKEVESGLSKDHRNGFLVTFFGISVFLFLLAR